MSGRVTLEDIRQAQIEIRAQPHPIVTGSVPTYVDVTGGAVISFKTGGVNMEEGDAQIASAIMAVLYEAYMEGSFRIAQILIDIADRTTITRSQQDERLIRMVPVLDRAFSGNNFSFLLRELFTSNYNVSPVEFSQQFPLLDLMINRAMRQFYYDVNYPKDNLPFEEMNQHTPLQFGGFLTQIFDLRSNPTPDGLKGENVEQKTYDGSYATAMNMNAAALLGRKIKNTPRQLKFTPPRQEEEDEELTSSRVLAYLAEPYRRQIEELKRKAIK